MFNRIFFQSNISLSKAYYYYIFAYIYKKLDSINTTHTFFENSILQNYSATSPTGGLAEDEIQMFSITQVALLKASISSHTAHQLHSTQWLLIVHHYYNFRTSRGLYRQWFTYKPGVQLCSLTSYFLGDIFGLMPLPKYPFSLGGGDVFPSHEPHGCSIVCSSRVTFSVGKMWLVWKGFWRNINLHFTRFLEAPLLWIQ